MPEVTIPDPPDPRSKPADYLRSIHAVRERSRLVLEEAKVNALNHFDVDLSKFKDTADYVVSIIKVRPSHQLTSTELTTLSETLQATMLQYRRMAVGNTLKLVEGRE